MIEDEPETEAERQAANAAYYAKLERDAEALRRPGEPHPTDDWDEEDHEQWAQMQAEREDDDDS